MRRFSSEGSLLGLDIFPWKSVSQKADHSDQVDGVDANKTPPRQGNQVDHGATSLPATPSAVQEPVSRSAKDFSRELSFSVEDLTELEIAPGLLKVTNLNESFKAYSDSQLAPHAISSGENVEKDDVTSPSPTSTLNTFCYNSGPGTHQNRHHVRSKLSSAKLHLKSLFGQVKGEGNFKSNLKFVFIYILLFPKSQSIYRSCLLALCVLLYLLVKFSIEIFNETRGDSGKKVKSKH